MQSCPPTHLASKQSSSVPSLPASTGTNTQKTGAHCSVDLQVQETLYVHAHAFTLYVCTHTHHIFVCTSQVVSITCSWPHNVQWTPPLSPPTYVMCNGPLPSPLPPANRLAGNNGFMYISRTSQKTLCRNGSNHGNCRR